MLHVAGWKDDDLRETNTVDDKLIDGERWSLVDYAPRAAFAGPDDAGFASSYIRSTFDTAKAWRRSTSEIITLKRFGFDSFDVGGNAFAAMCNAIDYMNTVPHSVTLKLPGGKMTVDGELPAISGQRKIIDAGNCTISHDGGVLFTFGTGATGTALDCGVINSDYLGSDTPAAGTGFVRQNGCNRLRLEGIRGHMMCQFLDALVASAYTIIDAQLTLANQIYSFMPHKDGAFSEIFGLVATVRGKSVAYPQGVDRDVADVLARGGAAWIGGDGVSHTGLCDALPSGIEFGAGSWDTGIWSGVTLNGFTRDVDFHRTVPNKNVSNFFVSNLVCDFAQTALRFKNEVAATGGGINNINMAGVWLCGMDDYSLLFEGSVGSMRDIDIAGVHSPFSGKNSIRVDSQVCDNVNIAGNFGGANRRYTINGATQQADAFYANYGGWKLRKTTQRDGKITFGDASHRPRYGVTLPAAACVKPYVIEDCDIELGTAGSVLGGIANTVNAAVMFATSVKNNKVRGGAARIGYAGTTGLTAPASNTLQTNNTGFHFTLYFDGGAVSSIQHNGVQIYTTTGVSLSIEPGDTWLVIYTTAPAMRRVVRQ